MLSDIFNVLIAGLLGIIHVILWPIRALFDFTGLTPAFANAIAWMFAPLRYFGYFIDLDYLGKTIVALTAFLTIWYTYQLVRFAISLKDSDIESPEI